MCVDSWLFASSHFRDIMAKFPDDLFQFCQEDTNALCHALGNCLQCGSLKITQVISLRSGS